MENLEWIFSRLLLVLWKGFYVLGPMLLVFWVIKPKFLERFRIYQPRKVAPMFLKELPLAIMGISVYVIPLFFLMYLKVNYGYSAMYLNMDDYSLTYYAFSFFLYFFLIDTWFYWIHRGMHRVSWLKRFHHTHHNSYNINPLTSYSFHIVEALLIMLPYGFYILVVPFHPSVLLVGGFFGILYNGYIHLGYDIPMKWRDRFPPLKLFYSSTQHSIHHHEYDHNFATYFTFWDKIMKTERVEHRR